MAANGKVPIIESARAGVTFMRTSLRAIAPAGAVVAGVSSVAALISPMPDEAAGPAILLEFLLSVGSLLIGIAYTCFVLRLALNQDQSGLLGLKLGRNESNLLGASIVVIFFYLIVAALAVFVFSIFFVLIAPYGGISPQDIQPGDSEGARQLFVDAFGSSIGPILGLIVLCEACVVMWLAARLSLVNAATIGEGRIMAFSTWSWTKGNGLHILGALAVPSLLTLTLFMLSVSGALGSLSGVSGVLMLFAITAFQTLVIVPLASGTSVYLYRGLRPPSLPQPERTP